MQVSLTQNSLDEYLGIVKNFMLEIHQRIGDEYDVPTIESHLISIIDRASVKIKSQKEQIQILQLQLKEVGVERMSMKDVKNECSHLEKRLTQKADQISILRQTVKTLYQDNQRISYEKETIGKDIVGLKEQISVLKKKLKRQEDEIHNHKSQLKKITVATEDKLAQYLKEDEHKQTVIKKLSSEIDSLKASTHKKEKSLNNANKKLEELKNYKEECQKVIKLAETLKEQNNLLLKEVQVLTEKNLEDKAKWLQENDSLKRIIDQWRDKFDQAKYQVSELKSKFACAEEKIANYQKQILMRTEKLKEKNKQVKLYTEEITKLGSRVEELSVMSDQVLAENQELNDKCRGLEERLEELRNFQNYVTRIKGDMSNKKSQELGKLLESLNRLQGHA